MTIGTISIKAAPECKVLRSELIGALHAFVEAADSRANWEKRKADRQLEAAFVNAREVLSRITP